MCDLNVEVPLYTVPTHHLPRAGYGTVELIVGQDQYPLPCGVKLPTEKHQFAKDGLGGGRTHGRVQLPSEGLLGELGERVCR